jgi:hypothetical protein
MPAFARSRAKWLSRHQRWHRSLGDPCGRQTLSRSTARLCSLPLRRVWVSLLAASGSGSKSRSLSVAIQQNTPCDAAADPPGPDQQFLRFDLEAFSGSKTLDFPESYEALLLRHWSVEGTTASLIVNWFATPNAGQARRPSASSRSKAHKCVRRWLCVGRVLQRFYVFRTARCRGHGRFHMRIPSRKPRPATLWGSR